MDDNTYEFLMGLTLLGFAYVIIRLFAQYEIAKLKYERKKT